VIVGDGILIDSPLNVEAPFGDLTVSHVGARTTSSCLLVKMFFPHCAADLEIAIDVVFIEERFDLKIDLGGAA
jgi:hypothetical protein